MQVYNLTHNNFRNLKNATFTPSSGVNVIYGNNAQGKTNLLEALWLFTGNRSFRGSRDSEMITFEKEDCKLNLEFNAKERDQKAEIFFNGAKQIKIGGIDQNSQSDLAGVFTAVVFAPSHLSLVKDGPEIRRKFIDEAYCQIRPGYVEILSRFERTLLQRNALLRQYQNAKGSIPKMQKNQLDTWDQHFALSGAQIFAARSAYIKKLSDPAFEIYKGISSSNHGSSGEQLRLEYDSFADINQDAKTAAQNLLAQLWENRKNDLNVGYTTMGPHRDNLVLLINNKDARKYGSQGQKRSAVIALKMAEAQVLESVTKQPPIALLDDVMSELDTARQDYILNHISNWQVFLTCCEPTPVMRMSSGSAWYMENGVLTQER